MISAILEITACIIAAVFGMLGFVCSSSQYMIGVSGLLVAIVVIYLSQLAEIMSSKGSVIFCKVLNKLLYVTIIVQIIVAIVMV